MGEKMNWCYWCSNEAAEFGFNGIGSCWKCSIRISFKIIKLKVMGLGFLGKRKIRLSCLAKLKQGSNLGESDVAAGVRPAQPKRSLSPFSLQEAPFPFFLVVVLFLLLVLAREFFAKLFQFFKWVYYGLLAVAFGFWLLLIELSGSNPQVRAEEEY